MVKSPLSSGSTTVAPLLSPLGSPGPLLVTLIPTSLEVPQDRQRSASTQLMAPLRELTTSLPCGHLLTVRLSHLRPLLSQLAVRSHPSLLQVPLAQTRRTPCSAQGRSFR